MHSPIKVGILVLLIGTMMAAAAMAESKYVSEDFEITMRTAPGTDRKIIALVPSGSRVEVVNAGDEWSEVRLANGKQGWVLSRYLTNQLPKELVLQRLQQKHNSVVEQNDELKKKVEALSAENQMLKSQLNQTQGDLTELGKAHETLKSESSEYLKLKAKYEQAVKQMNAALEKAEKAQSDFNKIANNQINRGMLYGGGLLVIGFIAAWILKRPKRKSPLL